MKKHDLGILRGLEMMQFQSIQPPYIAAFGGGDSSWAMA